MSYNNKYSLFQQYIREIKVLRLKMTIEQKVVEYKKQSIDEIIKIINNHKYYRAVDIFFWNAEQLRGKINVVLPFEMFDKKPVTPYVQSDTGMYFIIKGPAYYSFINEIPDWYLEFGSFMLELLDSNNEEPEIIKGKGIGEFFTAVDEVCGNVSVE
jgi:hypothetical protein